MISDPNFWPCLKVKPLFAVTGVCLWSKGNGPHKVKTFLSCKVGIQSFTYTEKVPTYSSLSWHEKEDQRKFWYSVSKRLREKLLCEWVFY